MDTDEDEQPIMEFELPLHGGPSVDLFELHTYLFDILELNEDDKLLLRLFYMMAALCDPMTQPGESGDYQLSVRGLADSCTALGYQILLEMRHEAHNSDNNDIHPQLAPIRVDLNKLKFTLSMKFFEILQAINVALRVEDELRVRHLENDKNHWDAGSRFWLPKLSSDDDEQPLKTLYYMSCTIIMSLHLMFRESILSPFTDHFVRLWKTHSCIIQLALELDRQLEEDAWSKKGEYFDTPDKVKRALMGSSAVRIVLAAVLEDFFKLKKPDNLRTTHEMVVHDMEKLLILDFFDPLSREMAGGGSLHTRLEHFALAMLILRLKTKFTPCYTLDNDLNFTTGKDPEYPVGDKERRDRDAIFRSDPDGLCQDLLTDLYYDDKLDDDVKYVFGHYDSDEEDSESETAQEAGFPMALRKDKDDIEFDELGRDWRDQVRGTNVNLTPEFKALLDEYTASSKKEGSDHFFSCIEELEEGLKVFTLLEIEYMPKFLQHVGQSLLNTVAYAATRALDGDHDFIDRIHVFLVSPAKPDLIEEALQQKPYLIQRRYLTAFELILVFNPKTACAMMDELLMVNGLRRLIIWFLCHSVNLHISLINHVYELVAGYRGNSPKRNSPYKFSRQGTLELSPVEKLMLLHEFLINSGPWLVSEFSEVKADLQDVPKQRAEKIVSCLCLLILRLIDEKIIVLSNDHADDFEDYSQDLQVLLFPWIGRVPEARRLYFDVAKIKYGGDPPEMKEEPLLRYSWGDDDALHSIVNYEKIIEVFKGAGILEETNLEFILPSRRLLDIAIHGGLEDDEAIDEFFRDMGIKAPKFLQSSIQSQTQASRELSNSPSSKENDSSDSESAELTREEKLEIFINGLEAKIGAARNRLIEAPLFFDELDVVEAYLQSHGETLKSKVGCCDIFGNLRSYIQEYPLPQVDASEMLRVASSKVIQKNFERIKRVNSSRDYTEKAPKVEEVAESEFNDEFLNGEGQFQEKHDKKKKKKKKPKKKKK